MRHIILFAVAVLFLGGYAARFADHVVNETPQAAAVRPAEQTRDPQPTSSGHSMMLDSDRLGHFQVNARVDGRRLDFMVDTGASVVALRESDAAYIGIRPMPGRSEER